MEAVLSEVDQATIDLVESAGRDGMTAYEVNNELADFDIPRTAHARLERLVAEGLLEKSGSRPNEDRCFFGQVFGIALSGPDVTVYTAKEPETEAVPE